MGYRIQSREPVLDGSQWGTCEHTVSVPARGQVGSYSSPLATGSLIQLFLLWSYYQTNRIQILICIALYWFVQYPSCGVCGGDKEWRERFFKQKATVHSSKKLTLMRRIKVLIYKGTSTGKHQESEGLSLRKWDPT